MNLVEPADRTENPIEYRRKAKEVILAVRLERELTKAEILSIYLNHVYLGHGAYGVGAAAETDSDHLAPA